MFVRFAGREMIKQKVDNILFLLIKTFHDYLIPERVLLICFC